jgi:hypothetical protein
MRDGGVVSDTPVVRRLDAQDELRKLDQQHQAIKLTA